jgi:hypothetical protein
MSCFTSLTQGDLSVSNYYHKMKGMADDLRAFVETITLFLTFNKA